MVDVAEVLVCLCTEGEDQARELLHHALDRVPLGRWPARGYLHGLATLRALVPETAPVLDSCVMGPALTTAIAAGAAIEALRADGDTARAHALPWDRPALLQAHVPPPCSSNWPFPSPVTTHR